MRWTTGLCAFLLLLHVGCSVDTADSTSVDQDTIYQSYVARYDEENDTTSVEAIFRFGGPTGTTLELAGGSNVLHSEYNLVRTEFLGTRYVHTESNSGFTALHQWTWTDVEGVIYINEQTLTPIDFVSPPANLSQATGGAINFSPAVGDNEVVTLWAVDPVVVLLGTVNQPGTLSILVSPSDLQQLPQTQVQLQLFRGTTTDLQQATPEGGRLYGEYQGPWTAVAIDP